MSLQEGDRGKFDTHGREVGHVTTEAETGAVGPPAKDWWQPPGAGRSKEQILQREQQP